MDADANVVFGASKVFMVAAGKAAIAWILTGFCALMRIPVVAGVVISHDYLKIIADSSVYGTYLNVTNSGAD